MDATNSIDPKTASGNGHDDTEVRVRPSTPGNGYKEKTSTKTRITIDLPKDQAEWLKSYSNRRAKTQSTVIREALEVFKRLNEEARSGKQFHVVAPQGAAQNLVFFGLETPVEVPTEHE